jgi:hypothetical protein
MKKIFMGLMGLTLLLIAVAAFAHPQGMMEGKTGQMSAEQQKFFEETKELRKAMHDKKFELMESGRTTDPDEKKIDGLRKEIAALREKIQAKAKELGVTMGAGACGNQEMGCQKHAMADGAGQCGNCNHNGPRNCSGTMQERMMK